MTKYYTSKDSGSGQFGICGKCKKPPTIEGHDGCLGELDPAVVMNACCGHGDTDFAYIQYWNGTRISGGAAFNEQQRLLIRSKTHN